MNFTSFELWLIGIAGAAAALIIPHRFSIWRDRHSRKVSASASFRAAVVAELGRIYPVVINWPEDMDTFLRSAFPNLQGAVFQFRHFVPWWDRWRFDRAWLRFYCAYPGKMDEQCYHHYLGFYDKGTHRQAVGQREALFHKNVRHLLSFARET